MEKTAESQLFRSVVFRALYDALGFTGLPKNLDDHREAVDEARLFFFDATEDFDFVCEVASLDARAVRENAQMLIAARQSGDYSNIPSFWRGCFKRNRAPSYGAIAKELD